MDGKLSGNPHSPILLQVHVFPSSSPSYCYAEITFKTDPRNHDYIVEGGGTRNYDPYRDAKAAEEVLKQMRANEEQGDSMKFLENKTHDSKMEMDILDALDDIQQLNRRQAQITPDDLLRKLFFERDAAELQEEWATVQERKNTFKTVRIPEADEKEYVSLIERDKTMFNVTRHLTQLQDFVIKPPVKQAIEGFRPVFKKRLVKEKVPSEGETGESKQEEASKQEESVKEEEGENSNTKASKGMVLVDYDDE